MKTTNEKVYRCDFCNKAIVSAGSMTLHERMCKQNPKNKHKCFMYCENLVKDIGEEFFNFSCKVQSDLDLYSYKLERFKCNKSRLSTMTRMPLECDLYKCEDGHDFSEPIDDFTGLDRSVFGSHIDNRFQE